MPILNEYGNPVHSNQRFADSATRYDGSRPYQPIRLADIDKLIPPSDWRVLLSASKKLFTNMGVPRGAILQKAKYVVGQAWNPIFLGEDREWGRMASDLLLNEWYGNCDIKGENFDFKTNLFLDSVSVDRDGDFGIYLTDREYPTLQRISAHSIGSRGNEEVVKTGKGKNRSEYIGLRNMNGVILSPFDRPLAYQHLGDSPEDDEFIPADRMIHVFDPTWHEQCRGLPTFVHALNDLRDALQSQKWEQMAQLVLSSISIMEFNDRGAPDENDTRNYFSGANDSGKANDLTTTSMVGGLIRYLKSNSGNKLEQLKQERPNDMWDRFQDRLNRTSLAGMDWPYSMVWKSNELNSVSQRAELLKARTSVSDRQELLYKPAKRSVGFAIAKCIKMGRLPANSEWWKWGFTKPPVLSIDKGNDEKNNNQSYILGSKNMTQIVSDNSGRTLEEHYMERAHEAAMRKRIAREVSEATGEDVTDEDMQSNPNRAPATVDPSTPKPKGEPPAKKKQSNE